MFLVTDAASGIMFGFLSALSGLSGEPMIFQTAEIAETAEGIKRFPFSFWRSQLDKYLFSALFAISAVKK